jgi:hypothetical protein
MLRRGAARVGVGALVAGGLLALSIPGAEARPLAVAFNTPGNTTWTVPAGVTRITVVAEGGQGGTLGSGSGYGVGGLGASVTAVLPVTPGQHLDVTVAGAATGSTGGIGGGGTGGLASHPGGGGGGASSVTVGTDPWVIAAGGGGAAEGSVDGGASGRAGAVGSGAQDGQAGGGAAASFNGVGGAGGSSSGIARGCTLALAGPAGKDGSKTSRTGGIGGGRAEDASVSYAGGGGGGAGFASGGGGGGGAYCASDSTIRHGAGGGGGGGSSFVRLTTAVDSKILEGVNDGDGSISITYDDSSTPVATPALSPKPNAAGWNNTDVSVAWNWTDQGSGLDPASCPATGSSDGRTGIFPLLATCLDRAGNGTNALLTVRIDKAPPTASPTTSGPSVNGWTRGPATVAWNWADGLSGLDQGTCAATSTQTREGSRTVTATCTDTAGNTATASQVVRIDHTAPSIKVQRPKHRTYDRGQHVVAKFQCRDTGVGVASCHAHTAQHHTLPTKKLGKHTFRVKAKDRLGNTRIVKIHYRVVR